MDIRLAALIVQFLVSLAFSLMGSFLPLFLETELEYPLIEATYWTGVTQLISSSLYAFTAPFWGSMCDRVGIRKITMIILAANAVVYAGMGMSTNIPAILIFRGLQGSFGGVSTAMFVLVAAIVPGNELKHAMSYQMAMMTMGSLVGPGIGGILASVIGYRLTFIASSLLFLAVVPIMFLINVPPPSGKASEADHFSYSDFKAILPDIVSLILVYACISFITPTIPWFLESLGIPDDQLLTYTALTTTLNGLAFIAATPLLTRIVTDRILPLLSALAAGTIFMTAFVNDPYHFIVLRVSIGGIQAGIPPSLLSGKKSRGRGTLMGFLNSARFLGMAVGPFMATSILGDGESWRVLAMFATMAGMSLLASLVAYFTHKRTQVDD
jgi:DHA1 family multidrug resistance protein-like MFS transporter